MSLSTKILIWAGTVLVICSLSFIIFKQIQNSNRQDVIEQNMVVQKQLLDGIVRSQSTWATKEDIDKFAKENNLNLKAIQDNLDKLHAEISSVNVAVSNSNGQVATHVPTTTGPIINPNPVDSSNPDPFGYQKQQQILTLNEDFSSIKVPIGSVGFSAWQKEPWNIDIKDRQYKLSTVVGTDENQRSYFYNKFSVTIDNKDYIVPITSATTQQVYPTAKISWFNPRLYLGIDGSIGLNPVKGEFMPDINVQIMSYGKYKTQPDFSILQVGAGYGIVSKRPQLIVTPVSYNVGQHIPLMNNLYIGPSLNISTDSNIFVGIGLRVGL